MYRDRDWLYNQYHRKERSTAEIAGDIGVSHKTISRWLHKHNIPVRSRQEALNIKYGKEVVDKKERAMEYYRWKQERKKDKPSMGWGDPPTT